MIKSLAQYWAENWPRVTARRAWWPVTCGQPTSLLGHSLRARAITRAPLTFAAWSPRTGQRGGVFPDGPTVASRR
jgi:hypothetical protein